MWIIVSGSSPSQLVPSGLILLRSTLRISILLQQNVTLPEYSSKKSKLSSACKAVRSYLIILLVINKSGRNFGRKSSTALLHISWVLYLSLQYFNLKDLQRRFYHTVIEF